jgi:serine phosphatase RsbU (regulator of sigma subunit)
VSTETDVEQRAEALFRTRIEANYRRTDRLFGYLMLGQWAFAIAIAILFSPYGWAGKVRTIHIHVPLAVFLGGALSLVPFALTRLKPGEPITRYTVAVAQMLWSALLIHLTGGRIETHFHVFGSLAFLAFYRDWEVLVPATLVVAMDHLVRQMFWPESVYGVTNPEWWRFLEHAFWVVFEDAFLFVACLASVAEMRQLAEQNVRVEETERAAKELEIAAEIQSSILPVDFAIPGLEVAARMIPADVVGGDYYDVLPVDGGSWIAIGDVAGHGVRAGLTMLQTRSALAALVQHTPDARPTDLWNTLNATFFETVRKRLHHDEHMTLSLIRYHAGGRFTIVGLHEEIVIWRAAEKRSEMLPLSGTWIGLAKTAKAREQEFTLAPGDVMVLYTDGIIEARDRESVKMVGVDQLRAAIGRHHDRPVAEIRDAIFDLTSTATRDDDASVLVFRYRGRDVAVAA